MTVAIERQTNQPGTVLLVNLKVSRPDNWIRPHQTALKPAMVKEIIASALAAGWVPEDQGSSYEYEYSLIEERS